MPTALLSEVIIAQIKEKIKLQKLISAGISAIQVTIQGRHSTAPCGTRIYLVEYSVFRRRTGRRTGGRKDGGSGMKQFFMVGTYSEPILSGGGEVFAGRGEGLYLCALEEDEVSVVSRLRLCNPSFLAISEGKRHIYAVNEAREFHGQYGGGLTDIVYDEKGNMRVNGSFPTNGGDPCHVAVSPDGKYLGVANYADGRVTVFRLDEEGNVLPEPAVFAHSGSGPNPVRQEGPHAHSIVFAGDGLMYAVDLGIDRLKAYHVAQDGVTPCEGRTVTMPSGSGPRTGEWSKDGRHFYLINELGNSITHMRCEDGVLRAVSVTSTLPPDAERENTAADVHLTPDGRHLYASNRGHDSIAVYAVDENGGLHSEGWVSCGGKTPRNFAVDPTGKLLLVANQDSDSIQVLRILEDGRLLPKRKCDFPTPVCIRFFMQTAF